MTTGWDDDPDDYLDDHESPQEYEAAQRRAEEPPDSYLEEEAERQHQRHLDGEHGGLACDCPPYRPPRCHWWLRIPRWVPLNCWSAGTRGCCRVGVRTGPLAAWRAHRQMHETDEPPF